MLRLANLLAALFLAGQLCAQSHSSPHATASPEAQRHPADTEPVKADPPKRVLVFVPNDRPRPATLAFLKGMESQLFSSGASGDVTILPEYVGTTLPPPDYPEKLRAWIAYKHGSQNFDVIVAVERDAMAMAKGLRRQFWPTAPMIFAITSDPNSPAPEAQEDMTGIIIEQDDIDTLRSALQLVPGTEHVVLMEGSSFPDKENNRRIVAAFRASLPDLDIIEIQNVTLAEAKMRVSALPANSILYLGSFLFDREGRFVTAPRLSRELAPVANRPTFQRWDFAVGDGSVGGSVTAMERAGAVAGQQIRRILSGARTEDLPVLHVTPSYVVDWRELQRWGIPLSRIPKVAEVRFKPGSVWKDHAEAASLAVVGGLAQAALIIFLLFERRRRRQSQKQLGSANERLGLAMRAGRVGGWEWDLESGRNRWFGETHALLGITPEATSGSVPEFQERVHPEDRARLHDAIEAARLNRTELNEEFRVIWPDGTVHWLRSQGSFLHGVSGEPQRMLGISVDITERKRAEEALAGVSQSLVEAEEQERARISRELHDNTNQRLALLALRIDQLKNDLPEQTAELHCRVDELWQYTVETSNEIRALAHELHPPGLEYVGLVAAAKEFCQKFGEQQKVQIDWQAHDVPSHLPSDISLCLFRVLQEASQNSAKHSGAKQFKVQLWRTWREIHLTVSDSGVGFHPEAERESRGLGLTSMQERVRLLKGTFSIESKPRCGTTIYVRLPLRAESDSIRAAG